MHTIINMKKDRIMIVEDEIVTARSLQANLEKLGYIITAIVAFGYSKSEIIGKPVSTIIPEI